MFQKRNRADGVARRFLAQFALCAVAWMLSFGVVSALLSAYGLSWTPASRTWQVVVLFAAILLGLGTLAWTRVPRPSSVAGALGRRALVRPLWRAFAVVSVLVLLPGAFFGVSRRQGSEAGELIWISRRDSLMDAGDAVPIVDRADNSPLGGGYLVRAQGVKLASADFDVAPIAGDANASFLSKPLPAPRMLSFTVDGEKWPLVALPSHLPVDCDATLETRLARIRALRRAGQGGFQIASAVQRKPPPPGVAKDAVGQWWANPVGPEVARLCRLTSPLPSLQSGPLFEIVRVPPLSQDSGRAIVAMAHRTDATRNWFHFAAVVSSSEAGFVPSYRLESNDDEPFDTLGESGDVVVPRRLLDGLLLTWRSRSAGAPGHFAIPAVASPSRARAFHLPWRRALPQTAGASETACLRRAACLAFAIMLPTAFVSLLRER